MKRNTKALIKDLELQIDYLIGYSPSGLHWKQEYHMRKNMIDEFLYSEDTPPDMREKVARIQDSLYRLQNGEKNEQPYIMYSEMEYKPKEEKHAPIKFHHWKYGDTVI